MITQVQPTSFSLLYRVSNKTQEKESVKAECEYDVKLTTTKKKTLYGPKVMATTTAGHKQSKYCNNNNNATATTLKPSSRRT